MTLIKGYSVADVSIEFLGVVIVALSSIFTNVLAWYLNYRSNRIKFETESRAAHVKEVLRDNYKLHNFLRQLQTPIKEEAIKASGEIQKIMDERPYNFKSQTIDQWNKVYFGIIYCDECPMEDIKSLSKEVWERICSFQEEYEELMGIKGTTGFRRYHWKSKEMA